MANCVYEIHLHGIMVVVFINLDWIFILMNFSYHDSLQARLIEGTGHCQWSAMNSKASIMNCWRHIFINRTQSLQDWTHPREPGRGHHGFHSRRRCVNITSPLCSAYSPPPYSTSVVIVPFIWTTSKLNVRIRAIYTVSIWIWKPWHT